MSRGNSYNIFLNNIRRNGSIVVGGARLPFLATMMKTANSMEICELCFYVVTWVLLCAGIITLLFYYGGCFSGNLSIWNGFFLSTALVLGGGGPAVVEVGVCPSLSLLSTTIAFVTDVGVIAVFVNKVTTPQSDLIFSNDIIVFSRNRNILLQLRFMNLFGHTMINIEATMHYYHKVKSCEGEDYTAIVELPVTCSNFGGAYPLNINVVVDDSSPLWDNDFFRFEGTLHLTLVAFDAMLHTEVTRDCWFDGSSIKVGHMHTSCFLKTSDQAAKEGGKMEISLDKFYRTEEIAEEDKAKLIELIKMKKAAVTKNMQEACLKSQHLTMDANATVETDPALLTLEQTSVSSSTGLESSPNIKKKRSLMRLWKRG